MKNLDLEIQERLTKLAYKRSRPYCTGCNEVAPTGRCLRCGSDDLARYVPGEGVDWHVGWVIESLIHANLTPIDSAEAFEESMRECWPETVKACWVELDAVTVVKEMDPVSWHLALSEWESNEEMDGRIASFDGGSHYFWTSDIERFLDESAMDWEETA